MKFARLLAVAAFACLLVQASLAQTADDRFIQIYRAIKQADQFSENGQSSEAYKLYREAQDELRKLQASQPSWNPKVIQYRLGYVADKLSLLAPRVPADVRDTQPAPVTTPASPSPSQINNLAQAAAEAAELRQQLQRMQSEKTLLESKLREALLAQPAAVDPREVAKAEEKVRLLQKENETMRVTLESQKKRLERVVDPAEHDSLRRNLADARKKIDEQERLLARKPAASISNADRDRLEALRKENEILKQQLASRPGTPAPDTSSRRIGNLEQQLKLAQNELAAERSSSGNLRDQLRQAEKESAENRKQLKAREESIADLQKERDTLKRRAQRLPRATPGSTEDPRLAALERESSKLQSDLAATREELKQSQNTAEALRKSNSDLETRLARASKETAKAAGKESDRIRKLEKERDDLLAQIEASKRSRRGGRATEAAQLQAKLDVLEARKVPFTPEELALFKAPLVQVTPSTAETKSTPAPRKAPALPAEATLLVAEAERAFQNRQLNEAEQKYQALLKLDAKNVNTLANLAVVEMEQNRLDDAEKHLSQAIAELPEDFRSHSLMGILRFRQKRFDDAFESLSKSAKLNPNDAETQNYLGITLSEKGQRIPAEAALRKAIQLQPGYGNAHHNLAIIYTTQKPPFIELARWHYQKSISAGHPRNPDLEKAIDNAATTAKTP